MRFGFLSILFMIFVGDQCFQSSVKSVYFNVTHENHVGFYVKKVYLIQSILAIALWKFDCAIIMENCRNLFSESHISMLY